MKSNTKLTLAWLGSMLLLVVLLSALAVLLLRGFSELTDRGLKNVIEEVWEGKQSQGEIG